MNDLAHPFQRIKPQSVQAVKNFTAEQLRGRRRVDR